MQRILHIMAGFGGGIGSFIFNIIKNTNSYIVTNDVASFTDYPDFYKKEIENKGGKTVTFNRLRIKTLSQNISQVCDVMKIGHYDIVYIHMTDWGALFFSLCARVSGIKRIIVHSHQTNHNDNKGFFQHMKFKLYRFITVSCANQLASCSKMASEFRFGKKYVDMHKVMHVPNSIDSSIYVEEVTNEQKKQIRESLGISEDEIFIGHVGRFDKQKNHDFMIGLIHYMKNKGIKFKWAFFGSGSEFVRIYNKAKEYNILDVAVFPGRRNDISYIFQSMDVSVLPSNFEGLPTVAIECQAAGTPMVLSDTITSECDMGLELLNFLSLNDSFEKWADEIILASRKLHIDYQKRLKNIKDRKFTSHEASKLYEKFILGLIDSYNFEDFDVM